MPGESMMQQSESITQYFDVWKDDKWLDMAQGETPELARQNFQCGMPESSAKDFILMPFFGLRTSKTTYRHLTGMPLKASVGELAEEEADPTISKFTAFDVWVDGEHAGIIAAKTPAEARAEADFGWSEAFVQRVVILPNYGTTHSVGAVYAAFMGHPPCAPAVIAVNEAA